MYIHVPYEIPILVLPMIKINQLIDLIETFPVIYITGDQTVFSQSSDFYLNPLSIVPYMYSLKLKVLMKLIFLS